MDLMMGIDFGSDSVRAIIVDAADGATLAERVCAYPRWKERQFCDAANQVFRHHPADYLEAMTEVACGVVQQLTSLQRVCVRGIGVDATGSTVCPVDAQGVPLALQEPFANNPGAMFHLWKDHAAAAEAKQINEVFAKQGRDYLKYQGTYSAEWFWAKIVHTVRADERIRKAAATWVELADWIPNLLAGRTAVADLYRCVCAAGHKALWCTGFGGLPGRDALAEVDPYLVQVADTYAKQPGLSTDKVGLLSPEWCERLGLPAGVVVSGSTLDAHAGAVGAGIAPGVLVKVVGTSTVDMVIGGDASQTDVYTAGACGMAQNSIIPGFWGMEAGQAAFGDVFAWFESLLCWPLTQCDELTESQKAAMAENMIGKLSDAIGEDDAGLRDLIMLDWFNGRRYPNNNDHIRAAAMGLSLGTDAPGMLRAMMLGTVMGSKAIFEALVASGVQIEQVIAVGGIAQKSPYIMQLMADALGRAVAVSQSRQTCALGAAMYAAVATGCCQSLPEAQKKMGAGFLKTYAPNPKRRQLLEACYADYLRLADSTNAWYAKPEESR